MQTLSANLTTGLIVTEGAPVCHLRVVAPRLWRMWLEIANQLPHGGSMRVIAVSDPFGLGIEVWYYGNLSRSGNLARFAYLDVTPAVAQMVGPYNPHQIRSVRLYPREDQVLRLLLDGHTTKEIAHQLGLSVRTIEQYRAGATKKLGARTLPQAGRLALAREMLLGRGRDGVLLIA